MTLYTSPKRWKRNFLIIECRCFVLLSQSEILPMSLEYSVTYNAENQYDRMVNHAVWQFLIIPEDNNNQEVTSIDFTNSLHAPVQESINGFGFRTFRIIPGVAFREASFRAHFTLRKTAVNPFDFTPPPDPETGYTILKSLEFRADFEPFLRTTEYTRLPEPADPLFPFDASLPLFENLQTLNHWVYLHIYFQPGVTHVYTLLEEVIRSRKGVCQDFTHLFCAIARKNGLPSRYVSGYLHQGNGYFGDSQMHAWAEVYIPRIGWVGFDPTNDILAGTNHIKVSHGKDYQDCAPIKGIIFAPGENRTTHGVEVFARQSQQ